MSARNALARGFGRGIARPDATSGAQLRREPGRGGRPAFETFTGRNALLALSAALCVAAPVLVGLDAGPAIRGPIVLTFFLVVPGAALVGLFVAEPVEELGLVLGVSLGTLTVAAQIMLSLRAWQPAAALDATAAACLVCLVVALARSHPTPTNSSEPEPLDPGTPTGSVSVLRPRDGPGSREAGTGAQPWLRDVDFAVVAQLMLLGDALALWVASLAHVHVGVVSGIGLMSGMPATFELALVPLAAGFSWAVCSRRPRALVLVLYTAALVVVLHGTTAVLYAEPRYTWVYKHFGVIQYLAVHGRAHRAIDIYQNWPGFFGLNAWFSRVSGWAPIGYAAWAQVAFGLLNVAAIVFCLRGLTDDLRHVWIACWIFVCANWLAQDYLAPQAFGFFETMVVLGVILRYAPRHPAFVSRLGRSWRSVLERAQAGLHLGHAETGSSPLVIAGVPAFLLGALCFAAVVVSHQLTPFTAIALVVTLVAVGRARPVWLPLAMAAAAGSWLYLAWPFVSRHFALFNLGESATAHPHGYRVYAALPGVHFVDATKVGIIAVLAALAVAGLWTSISEGRHLGLAAALAAAPVATAVVQSYGGEGWLRALLFALPWLAFLAARTCTRWLHDSRVGWMPAIGVSLVSVALLGPFLYAYFGQETINHVTQADVAVNRWYLEHAPRNSVIGFVAANAPARLDARYADLQIGYDGTVLTDLPAFRGRPFRPGDVQRVADTLAAERGTATYLVTGPSQANYLRYYGIVPRDWYARLVSGLRSSTRFRLVYRSGPAMVFQLVRPPGLAPLIREAAW